MSALSGVVGGVVAGLSAIGAVASTVVSTLQQIVSTSVGFVEAFAPSTVGVLNQAMADLTATVGSALVPVVQAASAFFKEVASALLPVMERLRPVVQQLADTFSSISGQWLAAMSPLLDAMVSLGEAVAANLAALGAVLEPLMVFQSLITELAGAILKGVSAMVKELIEAIRPIITVFQMVADYLRAFAAVAGAVLDTLMASFGAGGDGLKDACEQMRSAFQNVVKACVLMVAALAKSMGMTAFLENLKKRLNGPERKDATGMAAAKNSRFSSFADLGKQVSQSASIANGEGGTKKEEIDFLKDIAASIDTLQAESLVEIITRGVRAALPIPSLSGAVSGAGVALGGFSWKGFVSGGGG